MTTPPPGDARPRVLGVDVGGTTVKARLVEIGRSDRPLWERRVPTPRDDHDGLGTAATVAGLVDAARGVGRVDAVGLVVPGIVDDDAGTAVASTNVGFRDAPLRALVERASSLPVGFGQDVRAGALAEAATGAGAGVSGGLAFVPVGTGLAAAVVDRGVALVAGGWAGEIGQVVLTSGRLAGLRVEEVASAGGLARRTGAANALAVVARVRAGEPEASAAWRELVEVLADCLAWIAAVAAPTTLVVGGGLAGAGAVLFDPLGSALDERLAHSRRPALVPAAHGDGAAMVGAALLAEQALHDRGALETLPAGGAA
ncbi:ROK family protein [Frigoribacterium sp. PhB24]|uniref:ROK family protein n=1 Tax=Frigoribacterium sp. PhB24 TaxID=2485204 RepID=UPI000F475916|nr:ROK family protein [Frigoribacterium sp. PhB24]ROS52675.1 glucokinase [Frigoribacterium sp. PhB24]